MSIDDGTIIGESWCTIRCSIIIIINNRHARQIQINTSWEQKKKRERILFFLLLLLLFASLFTSLCMFYFSTFDVVNSLILLVCIRLPRQVILFLFSSSSSSSSSAITTQRIFSLSLVATYTIIKTLRWKREKRNELNIIVLAEQIVFFFSSIFNSKFTLSLYF